MTTKQIANFIAKKHFTTGEYKLFKTNNRLKIEKDASQILSLLKEEFNLSKENVDEYIHEIERTQPMPKTELFVLLINELAKQGLEWNTREELFKILLPNKEWKKYADSWNQWWTQHTEDIRNSTILASLEKRLAFEASLWKLREIEQKEIIPIIAQKFVENYEKCNKPQNEFISLKPIEMNNTEAQQRLLDEIKENIDDKEWIEQKLQNNIKFFSKKSTNQIFLLELLSLFYENGFYGFLKNYIFSSLLRHHRDNFHIKMKETNTLINLDNSTYEEIYYLLESMNPKSKSQEVDILTMKISTFRKFKLKGSNITKDELFDVLSDSIKFYNHAYQSTKPYDYYPAINLAYMLKLYHEIIPESKRFKEYDIENIYLSVKESIAKDKKKSKEAKFYATMSDLEFCLLLEKQESIQKIEYSLEELQPSKFLIEKPLFQMLWFINLLEEFSENENNKLIDNFYKATDVFEKELYCA